MRSHQRFLGGGGGAAAAAVCAYNFNQYKYKIQYIQ